jgi:hypothetical protein
VPVGDTVGLDVLEYGVFVVIGYGCTGAHFTVILTIGVL